MSITMNEKQHTLFNVLLDKYTNAGALTAGMTELVQTLACVICEEHDLQEFVNKNGTTYQVRGKSGDTYSRAWPEWQQLKETRLRKQALVSYIERKMVADDDTDELADLLNSRDV